MIRAPLRARTVQQMVAVALGFALLGGAIDSLVNRGDAGRAVDGRTSLTVADLTSASANSVYRAVRDLAPGARVILDSDGPVLLNTQLLVGLGGARRVDLAPLSSVVFPAGQPDRWGVLGRGQWTLTVGADEVDTLLVHVVDGTTVLVDATLTDLSVAPDAARAPAVEPPSTARGAVVDATLLMLLLLAGGLLLPRATDHRPLLRLPLALVVGVALQASLGLLRLPGVWSFAAALAIAAVWGAASSRGRGGWSVDDRLPLALAATAILAVSLLARAQGLIVVTTDSITYLVSGRTMAVGTLSVSDFSLKRGAGLQALHAPAFALGAEGLQSLGAVLLLAAVVLLLALVGDRRVAFLAAALLVASPQIVALGLYINSHLLVALLLVALALLLDLVRMPDGPGGSLQTAEAPTAAIIVVIVALVILRAEGTLLVGLLLLGGLRADRATSPVAWWSLGGATTLWSAMLLRGGTVSGGEPSALLVALTALGVALLAVPFVMARIPTRIRKKLPVAVIGALWVVTLVLLALQVGDVRFARVTVENLLRGAGGWATVGPVLAVLAVLAVLLVGRPDDGPGLHGARWTVVGYLPLTLLAKLGDGSDRVGADRSELLSSLLRGGGRVGWGDSANRMWMHAVLLVLFLLIVRTSNQACSGRSDRSATSGMVRRGVSLVAALAVLAVGVVWEPRWVAEAAAGMASDRELVVLVDIAPDLEAEVLGVAELTDRVTVRQDLVVPVSLDPPRTARSARVCAAVYPVTYRRLNAGDVDLSLMTDAAGITARRRALALLDFSPETVCLDLPDDEKSLDGLRLEVEGRGAASGEAAGVAGAAPQGEDEGGAREFGSIRFGPAVVLAAEGRSVTAAVPIAMRIGVEYDVPRSATFREQASALVTIWTPRAVAGVAAMLLLMQALARRRR